MANSSTKFDDNLMFCKDLLEAEIILALHEWDNGVVCEITRLKEKYNSDKK